MDVRIDWNRKYIFPDINYCVYVKYWNKLKQNNFINIAAMKINVVFEFNSFSAEVKASGYLKILSKNLIENCLDYLERESLICSFCTFGSHQRCKKPLQKDEKRPKQEKY